ncbi:MULTISPECIES: CPBP family intramembrane glutamic endopeptidase [Aerococcus]|uniref:CPBP family intramembrane glutamic endopeptidase n=1 Tax=Aerococcus TaxID=1375 RepID=UPI0015EC3CC4|nr:MULTISPECIES: type II CAAX endopeptidase family protein [Aerococcus]MDK6688690.1 type II CAAX endopeptidase family protein [Aerococcus urinae]MDK8133145.1 type II CAAX endopeptidase family protein [Aerococcus urinae]MDK8485315.1 type II CAAX endopeptidase family protein [Aerococcus urinae]MDL5177843.1 type II CAAX endopeptidase family protein [Aerococcus tenax]MDL5206860.1 type II CAAX endopeptidase family protein [Aerococcus tenax]
MTEENKMEEKSWGQRFLDILKWLALMVWGTLPFGMMFVVNSRSHLFSWPVVAELTLLVLVFAYLTYRFLYKFYYKRAQGKDNFDRLGWKDVGITFLYYLGFRVVVVGLTVANQALYGNELSANDQMLFSGDSNLVSPISNITFFLMMGFVVPILEELVFRGIFHHLFFKAESFWWPLILSSLIFGLNHMSSNLVEALMYILMGIVLYLAYRRRKNIKDAILLHMMNNGVAAIILLGSYLYEFFA